MVYIDELAQLSVKMGQRLLTLSQRQEESSNRLLRAITAWQDASVFSP